MRNGAGFLACLVLIAVLPMEAAAQDAPASPFAGISPRSSESVTVTLWDGPAPGAQGDQPGDISRLTYYPARAPNGTAVIIAPGGGYTGLAMNHEGRQVANWFNAMGVAAFVLEYRLGPRYNHPVQLGDIQRAIRVVRAAAGQLGLVSNRIGVMGFSAGGHLVSTAATHFDAGNPAAADPVERQSSRPDFLILGYPVISTRQEIAHAGSVRALLGENPPEELLREVSNELHVTADTPPTFIFHTTNDPGVPVENSIEFFSALVRENVPAEMHLFANGPHGVGLALDNPQLGHWPELLASWMRGNGWLTRPPAGE